MIDSLIESLGESADRLSARGSLTMRVILLTILGIGLMVGGRFLVGTVSIDWIPVTLGSLGGLAVFCAGYMAWYGVISEEKHDRWNIRGTVELPRRRIIAASIALVWFAIAWFVGQYAGGPVIGGLTVAVLLTVWRIGTGTEEEWEEINAEAEEFAAQQALFAEEESVDDTVEAYEKPKRRRKRRD